MNLCGDKDIIGNEGEGVGVGFPPGWKLNGESKIGVRLISISRNNKRQRLGPEISWSRVGKSPPNDSVTPHRLVVRKPTTRSKNIYDIFRNITQ